MESNQPESTNEDQKTLDIAGKLRLHPTMSQLDDLPENFYQSLLGWLLHKSSKEPDGSIMVDDTDQIHSLAVTEVIIELYPISKEIEKQKVFDFIELTHFYYCSN